MLSGQMFDIIILIVVVALLAVYIAKNKSKVKLQPILKIGKFPLFSMTMVRTKWGLKSMDWMATHWGPFIRFFGYFSILVGAVGLLANIGLLFELIRQMFIQPELAQVGLVLPFTNVPGLGYLSFTHWIIAIAFLAGIHEFAHGVVARAHKIPVKSSGIAVLNIAHIPLIPAAFVEPDEKKFPKKQHRQQHSVLAAGPVINIIVACLFLPLLIAISTSAFEQTGYSFYNITDDFPADQAGITAQTTYNLINGQPATSALQLQSNLSVLNPGDTITLGLTTPSGPKNYEILTTQSPENESRAYIGVIGLASEINVIEPLRKYDWAVVWTQELVRWLFLFNLLIGLMNLMPLFITDGGQIVKLYAYKLIKNKKTAEKVYRSICSVSFYIILAAFIVPLVTKFF